MWRDVVLDICCLYFIMVLVLHYLYFLDLLWSWNSSDSVSTYVKNLNDVIILYTEVHIH